MPSKSEARTLLSLRMLTSSPATLSNSAIPILLKLLGLDVTFLQNMQLDLQIIAVKQGRSG